MQVEADHLAREKSQVCSRDLSGKFPTDGFSDCLPNKPAFAVCACFGHTGSMGV